MLHAATFFAVVPKRESALSAAPDVEGRSSSLECGIAAHVFLGTKVTTGP
jgi:hypothetical protein